MYIRFIYALLFSFISTSSFACLSKEARELPEQYTKAKTRQIVYKPAKIVLKPANTVVEDNFDFLSCKFPALLIQANKSFTHCFEETQHYDRLKQLAHSSQMSPENVLLNGAKDILERKILHWFGKEHEEYVFNHIQPDMAILEQCHSRHGYFNTFFSKALTNHTVQENILLAAEYIFQIVKDEGGGTALFLGRSPCLVQVAYEEVLKAEKEGKNQNCVHLNFSGHPDALTKRESNFFKSETNIMRDIVTPAKLAHYFSYLDKKGILNTQALFIVDILGSGSSLNSFLRIMNAYYQVRKTPMPKATFLNLSHDMNWTSERSECFTFEKSGDVSNRGLVTLPADKDKNMKRFQIPAFGIPIFIQTVSEMLDKDIFQEFLVHGVQYPAQKWTREFDEQCAQGGKYHRPLYEYLRANFSSLIPSHQESKL